jgi:hypothetical protein
MITIMQSYEVLMLYTLKYNFNRKTHKNHNKDNIINHMKFIQTKNRHLSYINNSRTVCRPYTFPPAIDYATHNILAVGHPQVRAKTP